MNSNDNFNNNTIKNHTYKQKKTLEFLHKWQPNTNEKKSKIENKTRNILIQIKYAKNEKKIGKVVTTELDHCSILYELKFSSRRVYVKHLMHCETQYRWYALLFVIRTFILFISDSDSILPFHLIVYIRMLEFMFTSFDFFFLRPAFENAILLLLHVFNPPKWKMCTVHSISHLIAHNFCVVELFFWQLQHKIFRKFFQCCHSNRIIMWKCQFKMHSMRIQTRMATNHTTDSNLHPCTFSTTNKFTIFRANVQRSFFLCSESFFRVNWITCGLMVEHVKCLVHVHCISSLLAELKST